MESEIQHKQALQGKQPNPRGVYATIWRWHFYAGMIFMPFLLVLAVTGGIYLFKDQVDDVMYHRLYHIEEQDIQKLSPSYLLEAVKRQYPDATLSSYKPSFGADRTAEIGINGSTGSRNVFVNPYDATIVGDMDPSTKLTERILDLHGSMMIGDGSIGDKIIELSACWAIVLIVTGIYLWWPRGASKVWGVLLPRFRKGRKTTIRDLHAVPLFWLSIVIIMLVITGLPWSGMTGKYISKLADANNSNYPVALWIAPESSVPTKAIMDVPWAAENLPVPRSSESGVPALPIENIIAIAEKERIVDGYNVALPQDDKGVYSISVWPKNVYDEATVHIDQYSGEVLASLRFKDYGTMAKWIEIGISLHEGKFFGPPNLILCLLACIVIGASSILGVVMWWRRRPKGEAKLGAPSKPVNVKLQRGVAAIIIAMSILIPPVGITFIAALLLDWLILRRIAKVRKWVN